MIPGHDEWYSALEERHGKELQRKFSQSTVAVCGLGGLGSNISILLARAGVGRLVIVDFDKVELTNIHRQNYCAEQIGMYKTDATEQNIRRCSPYTEVVKHTVRITEENIQSILSEADIICEAFDSADEKSMMINKVLTDMPSKILIAASGMAGLDTGNTIRTRKITDRFYLCGDEVSDVNDGLGLTAPRVSICASHQANTVLRIISGESEP